MSATIVGAWRVAVSIPGVETPFTNLTTFSSDGTVLNAFPSPSPAPPGSDHKLEYFTTASGSWTQSSSGSVRLTFETLGADENGTPIGAHVVTAQVALAGDGHSWSGDFTLAVLDPTGKQTASIPGTVSATRIAVHD